MHIRRMQPHGIFKCCLLHSRRGKEGSSWSSWFCQPPSQKERLSEIQLSVQRRQRLTALWQAAMKSTSRAIHIGPVSVPATPPRGPCHRFSHRKVPAHLRGELRKTGCGSLALDVLNHYLAVPQGVDLFLLRRWCLQSTVFFFF